jgi:hypothetical protein
VDYGIAGNTNVKRRELSGMVAIGRKLAVLGGAGNSRDLNDFALMDVCVEGCQASYKSSCATLAPNRGVCAPCLDDELCCREGRYTELGGLCAGVGVVVSSCKRSDSEMQTSERLENVTNIFLAATLGRTAEECQQDIQAECKSMAISGTIPAARKNPLLCSKQFMCGANNPWNSHAVDDANICAVEGSCHYPTPCFHESKTIDLLLSTSRSTAQTETCDVPLMALVTHQWH